MLLYLFENPELLSRCLVKDGDHAQAHVGLDGHQLGCLRHRPGDRIAVAGTHRAFLVVPETGYCTLVESFHPIKYNRYAAQLWVFLQDCFEQIADLRGHGLLKCLFRRILSCHVSPTKKRVGPV